LGELIAIEEASDGGDDLQEIADHNADFFFADPLSVVALLRKSPGVALYNYGETHLDGFADATRTGLANEKIREMHAVGNSSGESLDKNWDASFAGAESFGEGLIFSADENELEIEIRAVEAVDDLLDYFGALSAEHDQAGGKIGRKFQSAAFGDAIHGDGFVEARVKNHAGYAEDAIRRVTEIENLLDGASGAADEILLLFLEPETRRIVCEVGEYGDVGAAGEGAPITFAQRLVEMGHEGDNHVGRRFTPAFREDAHSGAMVDGNCELEQTHQLLATEGQAGLEHPVVSVLNANAGDLAHEIQVVESFLQIEKVDIPRETLGLDGHLEGSGGAAMASAGIKENELNSGFLGGRTVNCGHRQEEYCHKEGTPDAKNGGLGGTVCGKCALRVLSPC